MRDTLGASKLIRKQDPLVRMEKRGEGLRRRIIDKEYLDRKRINQQKYINKLKGLGIEIPKTSIESIKEYRRRYPWIRHFYSAWSRSKIRNSYKKRGFGISPDDVKFIWFRDKAYKLKRPSIDRIRNKEGYYPDNIQFIELIENCRKGNK